MSEDLDVYKRRAARMLLQRISKQIPDKIPMEIYQFSDAEIQGWLKFLYYVKRHDSFISDHLVELSLLEEITSDLDLAESFKASTFNFLYQVLPDIDMGAIAPDVDSEVSALASKYNEIFRFHVERSHFRGISLAITHILLKQRNITLFLNTSLVEANQIEALLKHGDFVNLIGEIQNCLPEEIFNLSRDELVKMIPQLDDDQVEALFEFIDFAFSYNDIDSIEVFESISKRISSENWMFIQLDALVEGIGRRAPSTFTETLDRCVSEWRIYLKSKEALPADVASILAAYAWHELIYFGKPTDSIGLITTQSNFYAEWKLLDICVRILNDSSTDDLNTWVSTIENLPNYRRDEFKEYLEYLAPKFVRATNNIDANSLISWRLNIMAQVFKSLSTFLSSSEDIIFLADFKLDSDVLNEVNDYRHTLESGAKLFQEYFDKKLQIQDVELRDHLATRHFAEVNTGYGAVNLLEFGGAGMQLYLGFDCHFQVSTIHLSRGAQEIVGLVILPYGPWTMPGGFGSTYVDYVNKLGKNDEIPAEFLLDGCERIHFISDFTENNMPKVYSIKRYLGYSGYSEIDEVGSQSELEFVVPMSGDFVVGNLIYGDPVSHEELKALDEGNWNEWPFIVIRKDIYDRMSFAT